MNLALSQFELPIRISQGRPVTDEELMRLSAENAPMRFEREPNGEVIVMTPTGTGGGRVESRVNLALGNWAEADGRGEAVGSTTGFKLRDSSIRAADAAWISQDRLNSVVPEQRKAFWPICPEFAIEIRSESDSLRDLQAKMEQWVLNGAEIAWLIDPIEKAVTIYRPGAEPEHHANPSSVQGTGPIAGFELVMARVWG